MSELRDGRRLAAARRCVEAILAAGTTDLSVDELRTAAGISKRTFHRYFAFKAQAIRPFYAEVSLDLAAQVVSENPRTVDAWATVWARAVLGDDPSRGLELFRLIRADPEFWPVFLEVVDEGERILAEAIAHAGDAAPGDGDSWRAAEVAAVAVVASSRLALAATLLGVDPVDAFRDYLSSFLRVDPRRG